MIKCFVETDSSIDVNVFLSRRRFVVVVFFVNTTYTATVSTAACFGYINSHHRAVQEIIKSLGVQLKNGDLKIQIHSKKK